MLQSASTSALQAARYGCAPDGYLAPVATSEMGRYLAEVVRRARENAGRKPYHIASTPPGQKGVDPSTVWRFENGEAWPRNPDRLIELYAADLGLDPLELWAEALELWRADATPAEAGPEPPPSRPPGELGHRVQDDRPNGRNRPRKRNRREPGSQEGNAG